MHRRQVLVALPTVAIAGCSSSPSDERSPTPTEQTPPDGIELVKFTHPEYVRAGRETHFGAVLRNTADTEQHGTTTLELSPSGGDWRQLIETGYELGPDEQAIIETTATTPFIGSLRLRLVPFERTISIDSIGQSLSYGDTCELPNGIHLTVKDLKAIDRFEYEVDGQPQTATPPDEMNWYLVSVTAVNHGDEPAIAPYRTAFETLGYSWQKTIRYRAEGAYEGGELQAGVSRTGGVLFETRHRSTERGIRLRHPYKNGTVGASWAPSQREEETETRG
ncbi:hypothetical protein [Natrinema sp. 1APR25-10V2]|uniref:hypothetical protein n=1 Tax=Natrinema sp. 1APR25-10V2 TaxID=2951081 RepID=UPI002875DCAA|nr:hypothetical protein [Natrinema sp. 1APR25-10V2]MDS0474531.1 hypothetical protein [Natrinema sp. 1APR25-10V2]